MSPNDETRYAAGVDQLSEIHFRQSSGPSRWKLCGCRFVGGFLTAVVASWFCR